MPVIPPALEAFTAPRRVLDHGFVQLLDVMGDDAAIEEAARVSYDAGAASRKVSDTRGLIRYLMRHRHTSPFEMCEVKLRIKLPIFVERQWVRHRMASLNEVSARYSVLPEEFYVPEPDQVCHQSKTNKQGRAAPIDDSSRFRDALAGHSRSAFEDYRTAIDGYDIARETARIGLPLGTYTEKVWKIDLHNLLHFLSLRLHPHAQFEIRVYAETIAEIVQRWVPLTWEAFEDYRLGAVTLSRDEVETVRAALSLAAGRYPDLVQGMIATLKSRGSSQREIGEFITALGLPHPDQRPRT